MWLGMPPIGDVVSFMCGDIVLRGANYLFLGARRFLV